MEQPKKSTKSDAQLIGLEEGNKIGKTGSREGEGDETREAEEEDDKENEKTYVRQRQMGNIQAFCSRIQTQIPLTTSKRIPKKNTLFCARLKLMSSVGEEKDNTQPKTHN